MFTLLLVDDEIPVRETIRKHTDWASYGFSEPMEASNGMEALELIHETVPDVVLTDIKMPYMDGIELASCIHQSHPTVTMVILSGFDEFSYAQSAIRCHVHEYVLKPVSSEDLNALLHRLRMHLESEAVRRKDVEILRTNYQQALPILREKFLLALLAGDASGTEEALRLRSMQYGIKLDASCYLVASMDLAQDHPSAGAADPLLPLAMLRIMSEVMEDEPIGMVPVHMEHQLSMVFANNKPDNQAPPQVFFKQTLRAISHIRSFLEKYLAPAPVVGIGTVVDLLGRIHQSHSEAITALNHRTIYPDQDIISFTDVHRQNQPVYPLAVDNALKTELAAAVKVGSKDMVAAAVEALYLHLSRTQPTPEGLLSNLLELLAAFAQIAGEHEIPLIQVLGGEDQRNLFQTMQNLSTVSSASAWTGQVALRLHNLLDGQRVRTHVKFVEQGRTLIQEHHGDKDFSLDSVCDELGISPSYFSSTFKKETGVSFVQYLTRTRMERAKELLANTELKTYEISELVGFSEPNYFSFCFKRYEGISASQYRQSVRNT